MTRKIEIVALSLVFIFSLTACRTTGQQDAGARDVFEDSSFESVEGTQIKMITENTEVVITLNGSRAAADLVAMLPLEMVLIERNSFAKGMTLPERLSSVEATTREYETGAETMANESGTVRLELVNERQFRHSLQSVYERRRGSGQSSR